MMPLAPARRGGRRGPKGRKGGEIDLQPKGGGGGKGDDGRVNMVLSAVRTPVGPVEESQAKSLP